VLVSVLVVSEKVLDTVEVVIEIVVTVVVVETWWQMEDRSIEAC
jgi:hypothetical protein